MDGRTAKMELDERELAQEWCRRVASARSPQEFDLNRLAGYMDGTLSQEECEALEGQLAQDSAALDDLIELRKLEEAVVDSRIIPMSPARKWVVRGLQAAAAVAALLLGIAWGLEEQASEERGRMEKRADRTVRSSLLPEAQDWSDEWLVNDASAIAMEDML